ncbi:MAG: FAD-dependent monooxygenase [Pseudomonadota bacterium]
MPDRESASGPVHDLAVAGGGLVGAALALGAAQLGRRVLVLEPEEPQRVRGALGLDLRTVAISPASRELLAGLGVWSSGAAYRRMEVWEERGTRAMTFDAGEVGRDELGWIVENSALAVSLWAALHRHDRVTVRAASVTGVHPAEHRVDLELEGAHAAARLLVAADGGDSRVRALLGVGVETFDVGHSALATVARTARPHDGVAYQRFLLEGPVALLPTVEPNLVSVVWSQPPERAAARRALPEAGFCADLARSVQYRLGDVAAVDRRVVFPLRQQLAERFNPHPRALLVGDAARVLHPLAGLGANLGFEDVRAVLDVLAALPAAADPGSPRLWAGLDRRRRARARFMVGVMNALRRTYARSDPLSALARNLGVGWLDRAMPVKRQIMKEAMGLGPVSGVSKPRLG